MSVHVTNGTKALQWPEFFDLLKYLEMPQGQTIYSFKLECGLNQDHIAINGEVVKTIEHHTSNGAWHSKEYKSLCEKLGACNIDTSTKEVLSIAYDEAVKIEVSYMPFKS